MSYFAQSIINGELQAVDMTQETRDVIEALVFLRDVDRASVAADALELYALSNAEDELVVSIVDLRRKRRASA